MAGLRNPSGTYSKPTSTSLSKMRSRMTPAQQAVYDRAMSRKRSSRSVTARGGGDVRRQVAASGGPRQMTLAEKQAYATRRGIRQTTYTGPRGTGSRAIPLTSPNWNTGAMWAMKWEANPTRTFTNGVKAYTQPVTNAVYFVSKSGKVLVYQPRHNRMFLRGQRQPVTSYPSWLPANARRYIENN